MTKEKKADKSSLRLWHVLVALLLIALSVYLIFQFIEQQAILERQQARLRELTEQQKLLEKELNDVNRELLDAGSPAYIERYLRKWGMIKDGEIIIKITEAPQTNAP